VNLQEKPGVSSDALTTFAAVETINLIETVEQLPKEVEPSTAAVAAGTACDTVMGGERGGGYLTGNISFEETHSGFQNQLLHAQAAATSNSHHNG